MRAASEHPRIATTIAAALIVLALAGVGAGRALGGAQPLHTSDRALRVADSKLARAAPAAADRTGGERAASRTGRDAHCRARSRAAVPSCVRQTSTHVKRRRAKR